MDAADRIDTAEQVVDTLPADHPNYAALHVLIAIARLLQSIDNRQAAQEGTNGNI
ncbi:hypothetical protein SEA_RAYMOND7_22 [Mycobacterium phage Raymond7]|uniref:Uncharacterized protein n=2 Tax=Charlievirus TaxID=1623280 RepID=A0AA48V669_9CAUD|nr:hypothetical protein CH20_gp23 [Mycobacterium phage MichelleMyBell]YP_010051823.1 hypothetical protein KD927_gp22 [Mycobacterium phage Raymond7]AHG24344.1 hypothetical protein PBI_MICHELLEMYBELL_23 [Mycobacterium phage MichelleMyBell]QKY79243.1 hypothetical protein SEA_RAYMOND7_22 [Mycobacterium phage Raymond7]